MEQVVECQVIAEVKLKGNRDLKSEDLQKALAAAGISEGQAYNPQMLQQLVQELTEQYQARSKYASATKSTRTASSSVCSTPARRAGIPG